MTVIRSAFRRHVIDALEVSLGAIVVIAHNVFRLVPNEVPILCVIGLISLWMRDRRWESMGFKSARSWIRIVVIAVIAAALRFAIGAVIEALTDSFWPIKGPAIAEHITRDLKTALYLLLMVWTFAAVGEEFVYRGYLLTRCADIGNRSPRAQWTAVLVTSILFGLGHYYKGPAGMLDSGVSGLILGGAYLLTNRNLWTAILAHGFIDTAGIVVLFLS